MDTPEEQRQKQQEILDLRKDVETSTKKWWKTLRGKK
jgi:hypothetical protein